MNSATIKQGKHNGTEAAGRDRARAAAKIAPTGTCTTGTATDTESKTANTGRTAEETIKAVDRPATVAKVASRFAKL